MYIRRIARRNKDGSTTAYIQLAHNYWDPEAKHAKAKVLWNFGREDQLNLEALRGLARSVARYLGPEQWGGACQSGDQPLRFVSSRPLGGAWVLDQLWRQLKLDKAIRKLLVGRRYGLPVERALFAMVANRALEPLSKLAASEWARKDVWLDGVEQLDAQHLYRAMDFVIEAQGALERAVYDQVADLLNLEVDLLYFDTTSTYFESEEEDEFRRRGYSRDHRSDVTQVVIGLAVTRDGIPVRCWAWPGNTVDDSVIVEVKRDLADWRLGRVVTVVDRGFSSEENLKTLQRAGGHYIAGERMRSGHKATEEALSRPGRFRAVRDNLEVKEIVVGDGERRRRYILVRNPEQAKRDRESRESILAEVRQRLAHIGDLGGQAHTKACCDLIAHRTYGRFVTTDRRGQPRLDRAKIKAEERLDGKYLLSTSDDTLSPEDVALGYKQLYEVEDAFRTLKTTLSLRPVYHRLEDRIRAHIVLCWLALLLVRIASVRTDHSWDELRRVFQRLHIGEFEGPGGRILQCTEVTEKHSALLKALRVPEPPRFLAMEPASPDV